MSRTPKRSKAPGYEYWSRGTPREGMTPGRFSKTLKNRKRRREAKTEIEEGSALKGGVGDDRS